MPFDFHNRSLFTHTSYDHRSAQRSGYVNFHKLLRIGFPHIFSLNITTNSDVNLEYRNPIVVIDVGTIVIFDIDQIIILSIRKTRCLTRIKIMIMKPSGIYNSQLKVPLH